MINCLVEYLYFREHCGNNTPGEINGQIKRKKTSRNYRVPIAAVHKQIMKYICEFFLKTI